MPSRISSSLTAPLSWADIPDLTLLIRRSGTGDRGAAAKLLELAYPVMTRIATGLLRGGTLRRRLSAQDLVHDAWVSRIRCRATAVNDRGHYLALVTLAMKGEVIDHVRRDKTLKRTSPIVGKQALQRPPASMPPEEKLSLETELKRLEKIDPGAVQVVRLRYYGGCSWQETANELGITVKMARNDWAFAAQWLGERLG